MRTPSVLLLVACLVFGTHSVFAGSSGSDASSAFMRIYGNANPPYGFIRFCDASPLYCGAKSRTDARLTLTPERLADLEEVNRTINAAIQPMTDMQLYGVSEYWTMPRTQGDCEDYAILKRYMLMRRGWPGSSLLLTVVRDEKGDGHAVLTVRTLQGDFVLDNKMSEVKPWNRTPYAFVMRQSYRDPRVWVSLESETQTPPQALAGVKTRK